MQHMQRMFLLQNAIHLKQQQDKPDIVVLRLFFFVITEEIVRGADCCGMEGVDSVLDMPAINNMKTSFHATTTAYLSIASG
ncbi:hypothetical protein QQG55_8315 [Brugia pahangi]